MEQKRVDISSSPLHCPHTESFCLWQKNNNNTIVFVSFTNGWSWRTSFSPSSFQVLVNAFEWVFVLLPTPNLLTPIPRGPKWFHWSCLILIQVYRFCGEVSSVVVLFFFVCFFFFFFVFFLGGVFAELQIPWIMSGDSFGKSPVCLILMLW